MLLDDPIEMRLSVQALGELIGVETELGGGRDCSVTGISLTTGALEVEVVELPPLALVAGAFGRQRGELRLRTEIDDVDVLESCQPLVD